MTVLFFKGYFSQIILIILYVIFVTCKPLTRLEKVKQVCLSRCYQIIKTQKEVPKAQCLQGFGDSVIYYSNSIVAGGFGDKS